ncbi:acetolactate synthase, large subunit, biosynthetic type [Sporanaerobium hydrogeniformans]|uniref:Acetolactate synthase, large subunit, biosynthetic type n=1 Tax=Sporanaerobium hydrogeniformans TaxID=3072179 RepID=A0AC61DGT2_9FIRM|nr:biosynthetic-type acetolactate synthase large subunit [Sporanaerobium hydrogeniformans]PHV72085.1 acetolactate synthase, large subunit, biosynthetic type [Sporanaerobium hydrogeniformans]
MKLSDVFVRCLVEENIDVIFGYPGAAVLAIYESLRTSSIHHVLVRQEQAAVHSASGYARTTGKVGVCIATSGPGATNLITGIATAYMDSIPMVIFTGQVKSSLIGRDVFQEVDITGATEPFIKHSYLIKKAQDFPRIVKEAFYIAQTGRPGPVLIDIPMDIQDEQIDYIYPKEINIRGYKPTVEGHMGQIKRVVKLLERSKKPLICVGGGVMLSHAEEELREFVAKSNIPAVHTLMGIGGLPTSSSYNMGMIGSHGFNHANWALKNADTILFMGARIADRAVANAGILNDNANIIHIDIDPAEIGKITSATIPLVGDIGSILREMLPLIKPMETATWQEEIVAKVKQKEEVHANGYINPKLVVRKLSEMLGEEAIIAADVGQNQFWTVRHMEMKGNRKLICSGGFGTMGYSLPSAIGAAIGNKEKQVVSILGDGSFQMSFFELGTLIQEGVAPVIILFNNSGLGMVRELQRRTELKEHGVGLKCNPDFAAIARAYGIAAKTITSPVEIEGAIQEALESHQPYFLEFIVSDKESTL